MPHTPGPWNVWKTFHIANNNAKVEQVEDICVIESGNTDDARLIAEAPELLEIVKLFKAELDLCMVMTGPLADKVAALTARVNAAIARAEGN